MLPMSKFRSYLESFTQELINDEKKRLKHFSISAITFFVGYGMLYWINKELPPSLKQEIYALFMILLCILSFLYAISLQILYIYSKTFK